MRRASLQVELGPCFSGNRSPEAHPSRRVRRGGGAAARIRRPKALGSPSHTQWQGSNLTPLRSPCTALGLCTHRSLPLHTWRAHVAGWRPRHADSVAAPSAPTGLSAPRPAPPTQRFLGPHPGDAVPTASPSQLLGCCHLASARRLPAPDACLPFTPVCFFLPTSSLYLLMFFIGFCWFPKCFLIPVYGPLLYSAGPTYRELSVYLTLLFVAS